MSAATVRRRSRYQDPRATYGNVAYDLAYAEPAARPRRGGSEVLRPQPKPRVRERALARPKVQVREQGKISLFAVVGFLAVGVFAILRLFSYAQLTVLSDQVMAARSDLADLKTEETKLMAKYELAFDLSSIEQCVTADGSMTRPQSEQIIVLDLSEPDSVVRFQEEDAVAGLWAEVQAIWNGVKSYFG